MAETNSLEMLSQIMATPGFSQSSGMRVVTAEPGNVSLALARKPELTQFFGHFHGGVITALADQAAGAAVTSALPKGKIGVTVELKVNFLGPADDSEIVARARILHLTGSLGVATVEVFSSGAKGERLCAFCTATMRALDLPAGIK